MKDIAVEYLGGSGFLVGLGDTGMLRYNSKLPIVVYTPDNVDVKYRIWKAEEKINNTVVR